MQPSEFAAVVCALVIDGYKAGNAYFKYKPSAKVLEVYDELEEIAWELKTAQVEANVEFPIYLTREVGGLVESWAGGLTWRELCKDTSLDQGDLCRLLRRTVEILRQIPLAYGIAPSIANIATKAANEMDRFPVADEASSDSKSSSGIGFGGPGEGTEDEPRVLDIDIDLLDDAGDYSDPDTRADRLGLSSADMEELDRLMLQDEDDDDDAYDTRDGIDLLNQVFGGNDGGADQDRSRAFNERYSSDIWSSETGEENTFIKIFRVVRSRCCYRWYY